jgi:hypothetical protein
VLEQRKLTVGFFDAEFECVRRFDHDGYSGHLDGDDGEQLVDHDLQAAHRDGAGRLDTPRDVDRSGAVVRFVYAGTTL